MTVATPDHPGYLRYLPAVYATTDDGFLSRYLLIFEKLLTGLADDTLDGRRGVQELLAGGVIGNLFYSRFSFLFDPGDPTFIPPISALPQAQRDAVLAMFDSYIGVPRRTDPLQDRLAGGGAGDTPLASFEQWLDEFLAWLAGWVDLCLDGRWSLDKKRTVIAQIMALYRLRGTAQGLGMLLDLLLDLPLQVHCVGAAAGGGAVTAPVHVTVINPAPPPLRLAGTSAGGFRLLQRAVGGMPQISGYAPWTFLVQVHLPANTDPVLMLDAQGATQVQALLARLATVLDANVPVATRYQVQIIGGAYLQPAPSQPQLNLNAILGTWMPTP